MDNNRNYLINFKKNRFIIFLLFLCKLFISSTLFIIFSVFSFNVLSNPKNKDLKDFNLLKNKYGIYHLYADKLEYLPKSKQYIAIGNVTLERGSSVLKSEIMTLDLKNNRIIAKGKVFAIEGERILKCDNLNLSSDDLSGILENAEIYIKYSKKAIVLKKIKVSEVVKTGRNKISICASKMKRVKKDKYRLSEGSFTMCDCQDSEIPSWELKGTWTSLTLDEDAWVLLPVIYVKSLPVFAFPFIYFPLNSRQSGLLFPQILYTDRDRMILSNSFYLTLGASADFTYGLDVLNVFKWKSDEELDDKEKNTSQIDPVDGMRRLRHDFEFRWALAEESDGFINFKMIKEQVRLYEDKLLRFDFTALAKDYTNKYANSLLSISLLSDNKYKTHYGTDLKLRSSQYLRSVGGISGFTNNFSYSLTGDFYQNLIPKTTQSSLFGGPSAYTVHRFPVIMLEHSSLKPISKIPVFIDGNAGFVHYFNVGPAFADFGVDNIRDDSEKGYCKLLIDKSDNSCDNYDPFFNPEGTEGNNIWDTGEDLLRAFRLFWEETIYQKPYFLKNNLRIAPEIKMKGMHLSSYSVLPRFEQGYMLGLPRVTIDTILLKNYFLGFEHIINPSISYQYPLYYKNYLTINNRKQLFDEFDDNQNLHQVFFSLSNYLLSVKGKKKHSMLKLNFYQGINISEKKDTFRFSEFYSIVRGKINKLSYQGLIAYDWKNHEIKEISSNSSISLSNMFFLNINYNYLMHGASGQFYKSTDELFGLINYDRFDLPAKEFEMLPETVNEVSIYPTIKLKNGLQLRYSLIYSFKGVDISYRSDNGVLINKRYNILNTGASWFYKSPCNCWGIMFRLNFRPDSTNDCDGNYCTDFLWMVDLSGLGGMGIGSNSQGFGVR